MRGGLQRLIVLTINERHLDDDDDDDAWSRTQPPYVPESHSRKKVKVLSFFNHKVSF